MVNISSSLNGISEEFNQKLNVIEGEQSTDADLANGETSKSETKSSLPLEIEIRMRKTSCLSEADKLLEPISEFVLKKSNGIRNSRPFLPSDEFLELFDRLTISSSKIGEGLPLECDLEQLKSARVHFYVARNSEAMAEGISIGAKNDGGESETVGSDEWEIPCLQFDNLWETLIFEEPIKNELLNYVHSLLELSHAGADISLLSMNRLILLHGPPGTGKTTLCKALAQKLAIRTRTRYKRALLVEVNSHSLFSKWFSESGKLVQKLFAHIEELAEHANWLVFVLIDEVESLTMGRNAVFSGSDPSDSVRVVNAFLTQLDKIRRFPNVFIFCTSNLEKALDPAFVDRADLIRHIEKPGRASIHAILESGIEELMRVKLVSSRGWNELYRQTLDALTDCCSIASFSGRSLRKLPVLAYSRARSTSSDSPPIDLNTLLDSFSDLLNDSSTFRSMLD